MKLGEKVIKRQKVTIIKFRGFLTKLDFCVKSEKDLKSIFCYGLNETVDN
jgi:hypothetical protein